MRERKHTCDAEIGRPGKLWHRCGRSVTVESVRGLYVRGKGENVYSLWYCRDHAKRANEAQGSVRVIEVHEVLPG
jgi:hypothetical protein